MFHLKIEYQTKVQIFAVFSAHTYYEISAVRVKG